VSIESPLKTILDVLSEWEKTRVLIISLFIGTPFCLIVVFYLEARGMIITPSLWEMRQRGIEHAGQTEALKQQGKALVEISESFGRHLTLLESHNTQSLRKDEIIAYLLLEQCAETKETSRCKRLKEFLFITGEHKH